MLRKSPIISLVVIEYAMDLRMHDGHAQLFIDQMLGSHLRKVNDKLLLFIVFIGDGHQYFVFDGSEP